MPSSLAQTLGELDAGSLEAQTSAALRDIAKAVRDHDGRQTKGKGQLLIKLVFERAKGSGQLLVTHTLTYSRPTEIGELSEKSTGSTQMYCSAEGALSVLPEAQGRFDFDTAIPTLRQETKP
jgi:hypothetical protein